MGQALRRLHDPVGGQLGLRQLLKGGGEEGVPCQDGGGLAVDHVVGGPAPTQVVVVHGGQVVVNQGVGVHHLHRAGKGQRLRPVPPAQAAGLQGEDWADALAPGQQGVFHGLLEVGVAALRVESVDQILLNHGLVLDQDLCIVFSHVSPFLQRIVLLSHRLFRR